MLVTRGAEGVDAIGPGGALHVDARPAQVVDTVGAGDTFNAGLLAGLSRDGLLDARHLAQRTPRRGAPGGRTWNPRRFGHRVARGRQPAVGGRAVRALIQRVSEASVTVEGAVLGEVGSGLLVLICAMQGDTEAEADRLAARIAKLRIFKDEAGKMNLSVRDAHGAALVVSQFTLAADTSRGNRPGFSMAASPDEGRRLYEYFAGRLQAAGHSGRDRTVRRGHEGRSRQRRTGDDLARHGGVAWLFRAPRRSEPPAGIFSSRRRAGAVRQPWRET